MATVTGGDKLASFLREIVEKTTTGNDSVKVGFDDTVHYDNGLSVADVAVMNEYGIPSNNQPPRPFFRQFLSEHQSSWPQDMRKFLKGYNYDKEAALTALGDKMVRQLQNTIDIYEGPPLSPVTIRKKGGSDKQLIDTKLMRDSIIAQFE